MDSGPLQSMLSDYLSSATRVEALSSALESLTKYNPLGKGLPIPALAVPVVGL